MKKKRCSECREIKPLSEFHRNRANPDGREGKCKVCRAEHNHTYRRLPEVRERNSEWRREYRRRPEVRERNSERDREYRKQRYHEALERLGGAVCVLCGCEEPIFLTVDHADRNGHEHRQMAGCRSNIHYWILKATDEELAKWNLRVLCGSCQKATQASTDDEVRAAMKREHSRIRDNNNE